jgi:ribosomal protein L40E
MSALECLACRHDNKVGDKFCEACGSSLDLKLCPGCEAMNGRTATHCRSCAAELPADSATEAPAPQMPEPPEAPAADQPFRAPQRLRVIEPEYSRGKRVAVSTARFFGALSLVGVGALAYHFYGQWAPTMKAVAAAPTVAAAPVGEWRAEPPPAPASAPVAEVKQAPKAPVAQGSLPGVESRSPAPAKRTVTHTQSTSAPFSAVSSDFKQTPPAAQSPRRVTHTRPGADAAPAEPVQAAVIPTTTDAPAAPAKAASAGCPEAVAVLDLCSANIKGERN